MKFIFLSDTHFGGKNLSGYQLQPRYVENGEQLFAALARLAAKENIDFIIHGGDLTENSTADEITYASKLAARHLPIPMYLTLGNHDVMTSNCDELWLKYGKRFFPQNTLDTTLYFENIRIDILSLYLGREKRHWEREKGQFPHLADEHWTRLRSGTQNLPRIIVLHYHARPAMPQDTGLEKPIIIPENNFSAAADEIIDEFKPVMLLGGHCHLNLFDMLGNTAAFTASAFCEAPFECKIIELANDKFIVKTVPLGNDAGFDYLYYSEKAYIQNRPEKRNFEINFERIKI